MLDESNPPFYKWFADGELNVSYNCLDRHLPDLANKLAIIFESDNGTVTRVTYAELHDGQQVTGITAEPIRFPFNTCPGALANLQGFIGCALSASIPEIRQFVRPEQNCTHLYDLATLALAHVAHGRTVRQYDVAIPSLLSAKQRALFESI